MSVLDAASPRMSRVPEIVRRLREEHPDARCALNHDNAYELLVATILSAQCTDERVNQVTPSLFEVWPRPSSLAGAEREDIEERIRPTGFYRQKARYIQESSQIIATEHGDSVPDNMEALTAMPGVARKTANVVLGVWFGRADGIVVDTHVKRLARRLDLTDESDPAKIERDLMALVPRRNWIELSHLLIFHGRRTCKSRRPACGDCPIRDLCPSDEL
jgi:endonuclease-3